MPEVRLHPLPVAAMYALIEGDAVRASQITGVQLGDYFLEDRMVWLLNYRVKQLAEDPSSADWVVRVVVSVPDGDAVGHAGFHGPPDANGMVEIGYSVVPEFRRRGYAKAIVATLLERACSEPDVGTVRASISPNNEASLATIAGFGFTQVGEQWDDEDGVELLFELPVRGSENSKGAP
jgi:RimJ/RimL family protein N-acetyltransferase